MSIEVELNHNDYIKITKWYELCFGKISGVDANAITQKPGYRVTPNDISVLQKIMVMGLQYADDMRVFSRKDSQ